MTAEAKGAGLMIGVDVGGTKICALALNQKHEVLGRSRAKTGAEDGLDAVMERIEQCAIEAAKGAGGTMKDVVRLGIGIPGPVLPGTGTVIFAPNLGWDTVPVASIMSGRLKMPVMVGNDVNVGTWGEYIMGAGKGAKSVLGVFWGTGVGGGIVLNGKLLEGKNGTAAEIGHTLLKVGGRKCACGKRGCLEAYCGRLAIAADIGRAIRKGQTSVITELAKGNLNRIATGAIRKALVRDDAVVCKAIRRASRYLAEGIGSAVNLLGPDRVIIGGGVSELLEVDPSLMTYVQSKIRKRSIQESMRDVDIVLAKLGDDAVAVGAALLAESGTVS
ncbi:MAG TPA: ROK family protein [Candidatus Brocadiia bacterium]|nr:ROK family protein [Candidatus Brocadiia bacterium]